MELVSGDHSRYKYSSNQPFYLEVNKCSQCNSYASHDSKTVEEGQMQAISRRRL
jgi:hypothetical protein